MQNYGDATLVDSNSIENELIENNSEYNEEFTQNIETIATAQDEDMYFVNSRLERENIYSQTLETYQEIYNNINSSNEQKENAIKEIAKINEIRNSIMIAENLIKAKGFENTVIFSNENSVSVIVKAESLGQEEIAQIQNIVSRELEVGAELINISKK